MNDRIDELIAQATRPRGPTKPAEFDKRYFAELIIEECTEVIRPCECGCTDEQELAIATSIIAEVKQHFGVK